MALLNLSVLGARGDGLPASRTHILHVHKHAHKYDFMLRPKATRKRWKVLGIFSPKLALFWVGFDFFFLIA